LTIGDKNPIIEIELFHKLPDKERVPGESLVPTRFQPEGVGRATGTLGGRLFLREPRELWVLHWTYRTSPWNPRPRL